MRPGGRRWIEIKMPTARRTAGIMPPRCPGTRPGAWTTRIPSGGAARVPHAARLRSIPCPRVERPRARPPQTSYSNAATRTDRKSGITAQEGSFFPLGFGRQHKAKPGCPPPSPKWFHILCRVYRHAGGTVFRSGPRSVDTRVCPYRPKSMIRMERVDLRHDGRRPTTPGAAGAPVHGHSCAAAAVHNHRHASRSTASAWNRGWGPICGPRRSFLWPVVPHLLATDPTGSVGVQTGAGIARACSESYLPWVVCDVPSPGSTAQRPNSGPVAAVVPHRAASDVADESCALRLPLAGALCCAKQQLCWGTLGGGDAPRDFFPRKLVGVTDIWAAGTPGGNA